MKLRALAGAALFLLLPPGFAAPQKAPPKVLLAPFSGIISPVAAEFMTGAIAKAEQGNYEAIILELDTPGGLDLSMRIIIKAILASKVPVIVYVHPSGGRAASAGVFITMAAHVAAMTPGTNIGAAHPVLLPASGSPTPDKKDSKTDSVMEGKLVNDAVAYIRSIARERGRNEDWAAEAVSKSSSIQAQDAVAKKVVDLVAATAEDLLKQIDGKKIAGFKGALKTAGAEVERFEMSRRQKILASISDPNVAMILMSLGAAGLFIELYNPGLILPGVVGAISLIVAFYSFQTLSASYAGILLLMFGLLLLLLEIKIVSYGMLALGGIASVVLGMLMLFQQQSIFGLSISWSVIFSTAAILGGVTMLCSYLVLMAQRRPISTGVEAMIGARGRSVGELAPRGKVMIFGELWDAVASSGPVPADAEVIVEAVNGLTLRVHAA